MYQVLYRKYRPKVFDDVVGQEHITSTLQNELKNGKLSHAYLFTGSRGTGKTTCAKILAKAVNCLHPVNGNPCNECEICRGIDNGSILDVTEIDAASNNGVDNIRDIRDEANFAPAAAKYRVYIIDEVHMLSIGAFNALLKTLEEPPEHVKFILATTEVQKLPVTILSRLQRFDFRRVSAESMKKRMDYIASQENFEIDDEATKLIARLSDGGMRDALSMLDRCIGKASKVTAEVVSEVAGLTGKDHLFAISDAIAQNDTSGALGIINDLYANSFDMERLCTELIGHFRSLMIVKTVRDSSSVLVCTAEEIEEYKKQSKSFTLESILSAIDQLQAALANIKRGVDRRTELELAVIKLASPSASGDVTALAKRVAELEKIIKSGNIPAPRQSVQRTVPPAATYTPAPAPTAPAAAAPQPSATVAASAPANTAPQPATTEKSQDAAIPDGPFRQWQQVLQHIFQENKPLWGNLMDTTAYIKEGRLVIVCENAELLKTLLKQDKNSRNILIASHDVTGLPIRRIAVEQSSDSGRDFSAPAVQEESSGLDSFLAKASSLGINVEDN